MTPETCPTCREPLPPRARTGRRRKYCSAKCRDDAYRERIAQALVDQEVFEPIEDRPPVSEAHLHRLTVEAIANALEDKPPAPPEERLAAAVIETRVLAWQYRRLSREVRPDLSWRAELMSDHMTESLGRLFEGERNDNPQP